MTTADPHRLQRFVDAQDPVYAGVMAELAAGRKTSHWMWFVFPQLEGLGRSAIAKHYGIASRAEALAYAQHPVLGPRLVACSERVAAIVGKSAHDVFGTPDDLKLRSSMTLFRAVWPEQPVFAQVLAAWFGGADDAATLALLQPPGAGGAPGGPR